MRPPPMTTRVQPPNRDYMWTPPNLQQPLGPGLPPRNPVASSLNFIGAAPMMNKK